MEMTRTDFVKILAFALCLLSATLRGQTVTDTCDYLEGGVLERQMQTGISGLIRGTGFCIQPTIVNGGLEMVGATLSVVDGDTTGQVLRWNGTTWVPRLIIFPASEGGVDTAYNGLTDRDTAFVLGGPLVENTTITGQQAYDFHLNNMRTIYMEAQRTSGVAFSSITLGSTAAAGVDFAHYNEADNQKQAVAAVNYSTGNVMKVQDSASNGTYFQQYDNGGGLFQTDITSSNGATSKTVRVNRDAVFVINLEGLDIDNEAAFMMIDTFTGELKYKSPADFAGLYGDDWGSQTVSSTARFSGVGTSGSPLELAQQSATSGQVLKWSGSAWAPAADANSGGTVTSVAASAGAGISISGSPITTSGTITITNTGDTNGGDDITTSTTAGGDLSGTYPNPTVDGLQGSAVSTTAPTSGQVLKWSGTAWAPASDAGATAANLTAASSKIAITGGTGAVLTAATVDVTEANLSLSNIGGTLGVGQIANGTTGSFLRSGASVPAWETAASLQGSLLLPSGTSGQTLRYGSAWTANSLLYNDGTNIGINTTSPAQKLDVNGEMSVNGVLFGKGPGTGTDNTRAGVSTLLSNTTGYNNVAMGSNALSSNTTGAQNMAIGSSALAQNIDGANNMAIGTASMYGNLSGYNNVGIGTYSLISNTVGAQSVGVGHAALQANTLGDFCTGIGAGALYLNTTGDGNIGVGINAGYTITTGSYNTVIGSLSNTDITTGSNNVVIGGNITGLSSSLANNIILADGAGTQRIRVLSDGKVGFSVAAPTESVHATGTARLEGLAGAGTRVMETTSTGVLQASSLSYVSGTGTATYLPKWSSTTALGNSIISEVSNNIGINKATALAKLHLTGGDIGAYKTNGAHIYLGDGNYDNGTYYNQTPGIGAINSAYLGISSDLGFYYSNGSAARTLGAILDVFGKFGIATASPAQTLHVQGTARITGSDGTATGLMGRDADGDVSGVGLSVGLGFSGSNIQVDMGSGLNVSGNSVAWGGTLTENTTVDFDTYDVFFTDMPTSTTEDEALVIDSGTGKLARGQIPYTALRNPGEATYLGDNGGTGETVTWQPEDILVEADPTAGHLTVELNTSMKQGLAYSLFGCCNLTYNITLNSGTMKITGSYGTTSSYVLGAGEHLEVIRMGTNTFYVSKK